MKSEFHFLPPSYTFVTLITLSFEIIPFKSFGPSPFLYVSIEQVVK
jgi:hypothetical protein